MDNIKQGEKQFVLVGRLSIIRGPTNAHPKALRDLTHGFF